MTSNEVVKQIRKRLNKIHPTETFQDAEIWKEFTFARSRVYKNQLGKKKTISRLAYHRLCIDMIDAQEHECPCITTGCTVKRSKHQIPTYLHYDASSTLRVLNLKNKPLALTTDTCIEDDILYKPGYRNKPVGTIVNGYLYLYNSSATVTQIEAIWANPLDLLFIQKCTSDNCLKDDKDLIIISEELMLDMLNIVQQSLFPSIQIPQDNTGDNNEKV